MSYVGIDMDTRAVHLVKLEESGTAAYTRCELVGLDAFERTRHVRIVLPGASFWDDVVAVAIEEPQGAQKATVAKLKAVQGAILACIPRDTLVEPMVPARWRSVVGLNGKVSKQVVWKYVHDLRLGESAAHVTGMHGLAIAVHGVDGAITEYWSQDACDAYCLALAVSRLVETEAA